MKKETLLATSGSAPEDHGGVVNIPAYRASTILFPNLASFEAAERGEYHRSTYGRYGTPSTEALEDTINKLEGADHSIILSSGMAAIATSLLAFLRSGDHLLMVDAVYGPTRRFCDQALKRSGVETTYYDPLIGAGIASLIKENTKVIYVESPGSLTFEVQDIPAIAKVAHEKGIIVIGDSTWGTPLYMDSFALGIDVVIHSMTKYMGGHSDLMMGVISSKEQHFKPLQQTYRHLGGCPSGDNCYLAQRGLRSMSARLKQHAENAMIVAKWLKARPEVEEVLYPALPGAPGHELWKRDFTGATSLFAFALKTKPSHAALAALIDSLELFGLGYSWGGYESLMTPFSTDTRVATKWRYSGQGLRIHVGLEHPDDLIRDLEQGFKRMGATS